MAVTTLSPEAPSGAFFISGAADIADLNYLIESTKSKFTELFQTTGLFHDIYQEVIDQGSVRLTQHYITDDGSVINADTDSDILEYYRTKHGYTPLVFPGPQVERVLTYDFIFQNGGEVSVWQTTDTATKTRRVSVTQATFNEHGWLVGRNRIFDAEGNEVSEKNLSVQELLGMSQQFIQALDHPGTKEKARSLFEARAKLEEQMARIALFNQVEVMINERLVSVGINHDLAQKKIKELEKAKEKIMFKPAEIKDFSERYTQLRLPIFAAFG